VRKRGIRIDALVLIFSFIVFAQLLSYVVPQGAYERVPVPDNPGRTMVAAGTFEYAGEAGEVTLPPWHFLLAITKGLSAAQDIIFLILLIGGVIEIMRRSGAIDAGLHAAVEHLGHTPWVVIVGCLLLFSMGSFTIGMGEEYVPLIPIIVSMCLAMRIDAVVAMALVWVPGSIGWGAAGINPFGVLIAQNIAGVPLTSGWLPRLGMMGIFLAVAFHHIYRYARKVQHDPSASLVANVDYSNGFEAPDDTELTPRRWAVLAVFVAGIALFVYGVSRHGWYIPELNAVFLGIGLLAAIIARLGPVDTSQTFLEGCAKMTAAALIVGFARTIEIVLNDGQVVDSIIHGIAGLLDGLPPDATAIGMLVVQATCNFFIPSGSGQAFVTMPIMSPLATVTGVPQQVAVLAYQFGDGFTNMIVPTSAVLMGALALCRVPFTAWARFVGPLLVKIYLVAAAFLVLATHYGDRIGLY
jgi:uncharacterized ion transporter superfamily protein YfcC